MHILNKTNPILLTSLLTVALSLSIFPSANAVETVGNNSTIKRPLPPSYYGDTPRSDTELTSMIKDQLAQEQGVNVTKVNVETMNGAVTLSGTVSSQAEVDRVLQIARSAGAAQVVESTVSTEKPVSMDMPAASEKSQARAPLTDMPIIEPTPDPM